GFRWMSRYADRDAFMGLPTSVLSYALHRAPELGTTLECGVYFGRSLRIIANATSGPVHGFDSFEGLPEAWHANEPKGAYSTGGRLPCVPPNAQLHTGWFAQTLPAFFASQRQPIRLLHVDCDIYASTRSVLEQADEYLVPGSIVVFDDFVGYAGYEAHELRAFEEYVERNGIAWTFLCGSLLGRVVALRIVGRR
ncbi:MAG: class I SAM-dependent methyltransferase, partial [Luteimonas sp.]